jgi:hypothetical protein
MGSRTHVKEVIGSEAQLAAVVGSLRASGYRVKLRNRSLPDAMGAVRCLLVATESAPTEMPPRRRPWWRTRWPYLGALGCLLVSMLGIVTVTVAHVVLVSLTSGGTR